MVLSFPPEEVGEIGNGSGVSDQGGGHLVAFEYRGRWGGVRVLGFGEGGGTVEGCGFLVGGSGAEGCFW